MPSSSRPVRWATTEGSPAPLGATYIHSESAYNFALYSKNATAVTLLWFSADDQETPLGEYGFQFPHNKTGRVWHCRLPAARLANAEYYAYRVDGPNGAGHRFDPQKVLLDPYAKAVDFPLAFSRAAASGGGPNQGRAPLGLLRAVKSSFDWRGDRRPRHDHDAVIYEMHVKGFTASPSSGLDAARRGTFAGVIAKIPYLVELGVTVVELLPVYQFDPLEGNYWGYMPLNFFSPHQPYATAAGAQFDEFREMVKALHEADIEVVLDVVYNHTTEAGADGPTYSFRGIDNATYYLLDPSDRALYRNDAGCGNVLHCANPAVRKMIIDSMSFWVREMHVDGFRFDLASIFTRDEAGNVNLSDPAVISEITGTHEFENVRLIAEAWDLGSYQLGRYFPGMTWLQWNGRYRDEVRQFVKSDRGLVQALQTRLSGSDDLFPQQLEFGYRPYQSVNFVCAHDGMNLADLVSFNRKTNNNGGSDVNFSWNCGWEGSENVPPEVAALRRRQVKNFCALLMLSSGTPMFVMGDEVMHSQGGHNNPYDVDDETTWFDWTLKEHNAGIFRFFREMIAFRRAHPSIGRSVSWGSDVTWYGVTGTPDLSWDSHALAYCLRGATLADGDLYVMINAFWEQLEFEIQAPGPWTQVVDTSLDSPHDISNGDAVNSTSYSVGPRSIVVLLK